MTLREKLEVSINAQVWWNELPTHDKCCWAARAAEKAGCKPSDIVYAVEKPWKWKTEAWALKEGINFDYLDIDSEEACQSPSLAKRKFALVCVNDPAAAGPVSAAIPTPAKSG